MSGDDDESEKHLERKAREEGIGEAFDHPPANEYRAVVIAPVVANIIAPGKIIRPCKPKYTANHPNTRRVLKCQK